MGTPQVLVIGLDPRRVPGPWDPEPIVERIERGLAEFARNGVDVRACLFGLDGSDDPEAMVREALGERTWDVVLIGGGVRGDEERLESFERILNLVHRLAPQAAIAFNTAPDETYAAAARWL